MHYYMLTAINTINCKREHVYSNRKEDVRSCVDSKFSGNPVENDMLEEVKYDIFLKAMRRLDWIKGIYVTWLDLQLEEIWGADLTNLRRLNSRNLDHPKEI